MQQPVLLPLLQKLLLPLLLVPMLLYLDRPGCLIRSRQLVLISTEPRLQQYLPRQVLQCVFNVGLVLGGGVKMSNWCIAAQNKIRKRIQKWCECCAALLGV